MASSPEHEITREELVYLLRLNCLVYDYLKELGMQGDAEAFRNSVNQRQVSQLSATETARTWSDWMEMGLTTESAENADLFPHLHQALKRFDTPMEPSTPTISDQISDSSFIASPRSRCISE